MPPKPPGGPANSGCLRLFLAGPILVIGAPLVALMRSLARWKRGAENRFENVGEDQLGRIHVLSFHLDYPSSRQSCRLLTTALANLASSLSGTNDHHYLVHSQEDSGVLLGLGPSVQELAERFLIMCRKDSVEGRSLLWLSMDRSEYIGEYLDSEACDPDVGDTDRLLREAPLNWAFKIRRTRRLVSTNYEVHLYLPVGQEGRADDFLERSMEG